MKLELAQNPVIRSEMRARMRGNRAVWVLTIYLGLLSVLLMLTFLAYRSSTPAMLSANDRQNFGKAIFGTVIWMELMVVSFVSPALTAGAVSAERERQTFDLLRTTLLPASQLVLGKYVSALLFILVLLLVAVPLQSLAFLFGGVSPEEVIIGTLLLFATAGVLCAAGVFFSSFLSRTLTSTVLAYCFALFLLFGLPLVFILISALGNLTRALNNTGSSPGITAAVYFIGWLLVCTNPIATVIASEAVLLDGQGIGLFHFNLPGGSTMTLLSPWIPYLVFSVLITAGLLFFSVRFVRRKEK